MLGSQAGRSTSFVNRPIVVSEQAEEEKIIVFRTLFSTRFRRDFSVKIQVTRQSFRWWRGHATFDRWV